MAGPLKVAKRALKTPGALVLAKLFNPVRALLDFLGPTPALAMDATRISIVLVEIVRLPARLVSRAKISVCLFRIARKDGLKLPKSVNPPLSEVHKIPSQ